jgi:hypothetical protein
MAQISLESSSSDESKNAGTAGSLLARAWRLLLLLAALAR